MLALAHPRGSSEPPHLAVAVVTGPHLIGIDEEDRSSLVGDDEVLVDKAAGDVAAAFFNVH